MTQHECYECTDGLAEFEEQVYCAVCFSSATKKIATLKAELLEMTERAKIAEEGLVKVFLDACRGVGSSKAKENAVPFAQNGTGDGSGGSIH